MLAGRTYVCLGFVYKVLIAHVYDTTIVQCIIKYGMYMRVVRVLM